MKRVGLWMIGIGLFITVMLFPPVFGITEPTAWADDEGGGDED